MLNNNISIIIHLKQGTFSISSQSYLEIPIKLGRDSFVSIIESRHTFIKQLTVVIFEIFEYGRKWDTAIVEGCFDKEFTMVTPFEPGGIHRRNLNTFVDY